MEKQIIVQNAALTDISPQDLKKHAVMLQEVVLGPYGKKLEILQAMQLAYIATTTGLNAMIGELYMTDVGPQIGVLAYERKATEFMQTYKAGSDFRVQYRAAVPGVDAEFDPEKGDIGYVAILTRDDWDDQWAESFGKFMRMMKDVGFVGKEAAQMAREMAGPKPSLEYAGVVDHRESFSGEYKAGQKLPEGVSAGDSRPEMMDRHERAKKRARKGVLKHGFPKMDIPDPIQILAGSEGLMNRALVTEIRSAETGKPAAQLIAELGYPDERPAAEPADESQAEPAEFTAEQIDSVLAAKIGFVNPKKLQEAFQRSQIITPGTNLQGLKMWASFYYQARKAGKDSDEAADRADHQFADLLAVEE